MILLRKLTMAQKRRIHPIVGGTLAIALVGLVFVAARVGARMIEYSGDPKGVFGKAAESGDNAVLRLLLACGANPNNFDAYTHMPALYIALHAGQSDTAELLLERGADPDFGNDTSDDLSHLTVLIREGEIQFVSVLRQHGATYSLLDAILMRDRATVETMIADDPSLVNTTWQDYVFRQPTIAYAVESGDIEIVRSLIQAGADASTPGLLEIAHRNGHDGIVAGILLGRNCVYP